MKTVFLIIALLLVVFLLLSFALYKRETPPTISEEKAPMADTERFKYQPLDEALKNSLTNEERSIIVGKATERAFTGEYTDTTDWGGTYYCKWCGSPPSTALKASSIPTADGPLSMRKFPPMQSNARPMPMACEQKYCVPPAADTWDMSLKGGSGSQIPIQDIVSILSP